MGLPEIIASIAGIGISLGYFPQAYRIYKMKRAESISLVSYLMIATGITVFLAYGFYKKDIVIILSFAVGFVGSWLVLGLKIFYTYLAKKNQMIAAGPIV